MDNTNNTGMAAPLPEPIAIVGMSCRLSGDVSTLDDFWTLLSRSRDGWGPIPEDRISSKAYYHPNPQKKGCFNPKGGYYMNKDFAEFDAPFFHISKQEALAMDPQQRQLLECTYEALENAGFAKQSIAGRNMGVFIGGSSSDYRVGTLMKDPSQVPMFDATGNHQALQAGRISYYFDLRGPCFSLDTACSSGLVALHSAVQSIRSGESDSAVVAGCSLHLYPDDIISMSMLGIFNDQGKTFAFDHRANSGFARGEGAGCLILKPLSQALKDNDKIRSVIVNSGTNQDGRTVGLSLPSGDAQERLIREVYARAHISPQDTGFVEAHGTGTKVGDPIEADAIHRVFGAGRTKRFPLYMGSVKTNIGHLENASGIISIIKASLMLEKGFILPNVNFEKANEKIPLDEWNIRIPTSIRPWPKNKRFISVNNFGFGGSNAHVVLERAPYAIQDIPPTLLNEHPKLFVLSANDEAALRCLAAQVGVYVEQHPEVFQKRLVRDMAYTLGERRTHLPLRIAIPASSLNDLAVALNAIDVIPKRASRAPRIAYVYTGQGAQWPEMGKELMESHPIFAKTVTAASDYLRTLGADFSLLEELAKDRDESLVNRAHISQPICTAIQLGITDLLTSWGIKPTMVMGHSSGEIGAAYAANAISMEHAMAVAYHRGQVASNIKVKYPDLCGAMLAVGAGSSEIKSVIKSMGLQNINVACENSPNSITASGDERAIDELAAELENLNVFNRKLRVDVAYHSSHMKLLANDYLASIDGITSQASEGVEFYSSLLGKKLESTAALGAGYWVDNLTQPVLFSPAFEHMYNQAKPDVVVEIGPHSALEGPIKQILKSISTQAATDVKYLPTLLRNQCATSTALKLAGNLFTHGQSLNFSAVNEPNTEIQLPTLISDFTPYPWTHQKYWFETRISKQHRLKPFPRHDLLGSLEDAYSDADPTWRNILTLDDVPWLRGHRMQSLITFPLTGFMCMVVEAMSQRAHLRGIQANQIAGFCIREVALSKAFILDDGAQYETLVSLRAYAEGTRSYSNEWDEFRISSWSANRGWLEHCRGLISIKKPSSGNPVRDFQLQPSSIIRKRAMYLAGGEVPLDKLYSDLDECGVGYTSAFNLSSDAGLQVHGQYSSCSISVPDTASLMPHAYETPSILPTAFVDMFIHLTFAILGAGQGKIPSLFMPSAVKEIEISASVPNQAGDQLEVIAHGRPDFASPGPVDFAIDAWHPDHSEPVVKFTGIRMTPVNGDIGQSLVPRSLCYEVQWEPLGGVKAIEANGSLHHRNGSEAGVARTSRTFSVSSAQTDYVNGGHAARRSIIQMTNGNGHINGDARAYEEGHSMHLNGYAKSETNGHSELNGSNGHSNGVNKRQSRFSEITKQAYNSIFDSGNHVVPTIPETNGSNGHKKADSIVMKHQRTTSRYSLSPLYSELGDVEIVLISDNDESNTLLSAVVDLIDLRTGSRPSIAPFSSIEPSGTSSYICMVELDGPFLHGMSQETFEKVQKLLLTCSSMLWVTSGAYRFPETPQNNLAQGLLRTVRSEASKAAAFLDMDPHSQLRPADRAELILKALKASLAAPEDDSPVDYEFAEENGQLVVPRIVEQESMNLALFRETQPQAPYLQDFEQPGRRLQVAVGTLGALDSLYWKDEAELPLSENEIEIKVACTGMNFKDVVIAMGQVASPYLGIECSGTVARVGSNVTSLEVGDRVCAMSLGAYGTYARCSATSAAIIPDDISFDTAASIPVVYSTAYYGLLDLARLEAGEKILIHAASGGVGQAAIQLAQMIGAEIYATVGSAEKKQLLIDVYGIPENRIFYSRDTEFGSAIREATGGVDVVINSLAGDLLRETWECLAPFGRFVEIGKRDITSNTRLEMAKFEYNCSFFSVDLTLVAAERPRIMGRILTAVMDLLAAKTVNPIGPITTVGISEVETALRKLQSGKTSGKVIVSHLGGEQVKATHPAMITDSLDGGVTYLIIGGTGGIGRSIAKRMIQRGARHIVLLSRSGKVTKELNQLVQDSRLLGASIYIIKRCDVANAARVKSLIAELEMTLPPIRGVIHAAMVLRDVLYEKMTFREYEEVIESKVSGAWNLHNALIRTPLDFFVVLSSVAGIIGNRGQAAYAAANTFLDAFTHFRRSKGLPATSLDLTAVSGIGYLAENAAKQSEVLKNLAGNTMGESEVLALVEAAMTGDAEQTCGGQCITGLDFEDGSCLPYYASDAKFSHLREAALAKAIDANPSLALADVPIGQRLRKAADFEEAQEIVAIGVRDKLGAILMLPAEVMVSQQGTTSITDFGLDSLNAIELRNWIGKELQAHLQVLELLSSGKLHDLASIVLKKTRLEGAWSTKTIAD